MKKKIVTALQYLFFLGLGLFFVWLSVRNISAADWQQIVDSVKAARHWLVIPVTIMLLAAHYFRALRWKLLMNTIGYHPSNFNTWAAVMIGYLVNAGVPRLGEVVKCTLLARYEKIRADKLVGTIVLERIIDVVCLVIVFLLTLLFQGHVIGDFTADLFSGAISNDFISSPKGLLVVIGLVLVIVLLFSLLKKYSHINVVSKIKGALNNVAHGIGTIRHLQQRGLFLLYTVLIWLLYLGSTTAGIYALHETEHLGVGAGLTILTVGSLAMIVTPGGIGAYPLVVASLMKEYGLDPHTIGSALGWLLWSAQTVIILVGGVIFFALLQVFNKNNNGESKPQP